MRLHAVTLGCLAILVSAGVARAQTTSASVYQFNNRFSGPCAATLAAADGRLYGITSGVGTHLGEIFRIDPFGADGNYTALGTLPLDGSLGKKLGPLVQATDGNFYTTSAEGGAHGRGAILRITPSGAVTVLFSFGPDAAKGFNPLGGLTVGGDGLLYGTTNDDGTTLGTVFRISLTGTFSTLKSFTGFNGSRPEGPPVAMPDGMLYGLASKVLYRIAPDGTFTVVATDLDLNSSSDVSAVAPASDGALYVTQEFRFPGSGRVKRLTTSGSLSDVYAFSGTSGQPRHPAGGVTEASDGLLYGTTTWDGNGIAQVFLFGVTKAGLLDRLVAVPTSARSNDMSVRHVTEAPDGSFFVSACDALVRVRAPADVSVWRSFPHSGSGPAAALIEGSDGNLYGTTSAGGQYGHGTIFRVSRSGVLTTIVSMDLANRQPDSELVRTDDGTLYGASFNSIFRVSPQGTITTLTTFPPPLDVPPWELPIGFHTSIVAGPDGGIYGVTSHGEQDFDCGTFFKVEPSGTVSRVSVFNQGVCHPIGQLVRGSDGFLYGADKTAGHASGYYRLSLTGITTRVSAADIPDHLRDPLAMRTRDGEGYRVVRSGTVLEGGAVVKDAPSFTAAVRSLAFGATVGPSGFVAKTADQQIRLTQLGEGVVTWEANTREPWLFVSPSGGTGAGTITVGVQYAAGLPASGTVTGMVHFGSTGALAQIAPIPVTLTITPVASTVAPFGVVDTPLDGVTVSGSIAVTGWALDDVGVNAVRIYRDAVPPEVAGTPVFIGNAVMIEGARPDVAAAHPAVPGATHAGWGYLLLTNMLPAQGNGTFQLHVFAEDIEGNRTLLGSRTIVAANSTATAPFGAIDTPAQGEIVSGSSYANFGWVLGRSPRRADPPGGGSVTVFIDGVPVGSPGGWTSRADVAALFPAAEYEGVTNALGVFTFDTTSLSNGVHTIAWVVTDNQGESAGIGSRYFIVQNGSSSRWAAQSAPPAFGATNAAHDETIVRGRVSPDRAAALRTFPRDGDTTVVRTTLLQRVELHLGPASETDRIGRRFTGYLRVGDDLRPMPFGAQIDPATGVFTWQPGVGFVGAYDLTFVQWIGGFAVARQDVRVIFDPRAR